MRSVVLAVLILLFSGFASAEEGIRQVDFKNLSYPLSGYTLGHNRLKWLDVSAVPHIRLTNGKDHSRPPGFTLESVSFADVAGERQDDAIVVLHFNTGGTQQTDYVYIYSIAVGKPKLLAYFHAGDRAYSGLSRVYGEDGKLVVELFDPEKQSGDCCSSGIVRTRFKWQHGRFEAVGVSEHEIIEEH
jgi:hypothetical protein